jgi:hypothetical protein
LKTTIHNDDVSVKDKKSKRVSFNFEPVSEQTQQEISQIRENGISLLSFSVLFAHMRKGGSVSLNAPGKTDQEKTQDAAKEQQTNAAKFSLGSHITTPNSNEAGFNTNSVVDSSKPVFSFGPPKGLANKEINTQSGSESTKDSKTTFSLQSVPQVSEPSTTAASEKPSLFSLPTSTKPEESASSSKPVFSFGNGNAVKDPAAGSKDEEKVPEAQKSGTTFGITNSEQASKQPPVFSFSSQGTKPSSAPTFTFGSSQEVSGASSDKNSQLETSKQNSAVIIGANQISSTATPFSLPGASNVTKPQVPMPIFKTAQKADDKPSASGLSTSSALTPSGGISDNKPTFSFGSSMSDKKPNETPKFSFSGPSVTNKDEPKVDAKPVFSFGVISTEKKDESQAGVKPAFSFGSTNEVKPGEPQSSVKPVFSFGSLNGAKKDEQPAGTKPVFSFGSSTEVKKDEPKAFSFGSSNVAKPNEPTVENKSMFSFGTTNLAKNVEAKADPKPLFSFGTTASKTDEPKPSFSFGAPVVSEEKKAETKSTFSFGVPTSQKKEEPKALFSFGSSAPEKKEETKQAFSFGTTTTNTPGSASQGFAFSSTKTGTGFGASTQVSGSGASFGFGSAPQPTSFSSTNVADKPQVTPFVFGATSTPSNGTQSSSVFAFGTNANSSNPPPVSSFGGASQPSTSFSFGSQAPASSVSETIRLSFYLFFPNDAL